MKLLSGLFTAILFFTVSMSAKAQTQNTKNKQKMYQSAPKHAASPQNAKLQNNQESAPQKFKEKKYNTTAPSGNSNNQTVKPNLNQSSAPSKSTEFKAIEPSNNGAAQNQGTLKRNQKAPQR